MNNLRFRWAAVMLSLMVSCAQMPGLAQSSGNPVQDLWENLQDLQDPDEGAFPYADLIQSDPVRTGSAYVARINGIEKATWRPSGSVSPDRLSTTIIINGRNAIIYIDQDRSAEGVASYSFQFEITELRNQNGIKSPPKCPPHSLESRVRQCRPISRAGGVSVRSCPGFRQLAPQRVCSTRQPA
jgi:hypothetical protein